MAALTPLSIMAQGVVWRLSPLAVVILSVLLIALFVWLDRRKKPVTIEPVKTSVPASLKEEPAPAISLMEPAAPAAVLSIPIAGSFEAPAMSERVVLLPADDLEIIEGIGPKIASVLQQAGVKTLAQLAQMEPERITEILQTAGVRLADPRSWPEQARLAAAGEAEALKDLQSRLKGGRVV